MVSEYLDLDTIAEAEVPTTEVALDAYGGKVVVLKQIDAFRIGKVFKTDSDRRETGNQHLIATLIAASICNPDGSFKYDDINDGVEVVLKMPFDALLALKEQAELLTPLTPEALMRRSKKLQAPSTSDS